MLNQSSSSTRLFALFLASVAALMISERAAFAQTTSFTYQGKLTDGENPADGPYDFRFRLFNLATDGSQQGPTLTLANVTVTGGVFTLQLDFGVCPSCFTGAKRYLEIGVKLPSDSTYTVLSPRQQILSAPYAIKSANALTADSLSDICVNCVTSNQIASVAGSAVAGLIPVASLPAGSGNYIQNATAQQAASNFNISGNGSANVFDAATQYNIGGSRVLSNAGTQNLFAGIGAGQANAASFNAFFGWGAGNANTTGEANSFFGESSGRSNTEGINNSFLGASAGRSNTTGSYNSFFGTSAGFSNTTGGNNSFFGESAGRSNQSGNTNNFFGWEAGVNNTGGSNNLFFGAQAGAQNTSGSFNSFLGDGAGRLNATGNFNTMVGSETAVGANNLTNATAIGANARVDQSNSIVLGSIFGVNGATSYTNVGIGTTRPQSSLTIRRDAAASIGPSITLMNGGGAAGSSIDINLLTYDPLGNSPSARILITDEGDFSNSITFYTKIPGAIFNSMSPRFAIKSNGNIGIGSDSPPDKLFVFGDVRVGTIGSSGCVKNNAGSAIAGTCSSDARLKRDITPFPNLLERLVQLRPVHFYWRASEFPDRRFGTGQSYGLIAQEVERELPELVSEDDRGYKAVDYSKLPLLLLQAIKEIKAENDSLRGQNAILKRQNEAIGRRVAALERAARRGAVK